jgi:hypothetical protein
MKMGRRMGLAAMVALGFSGYFVPATAANTQAPTWLRRDWVRDWIEEGTKQSNTLDVHYIQTPTYFADIRFPKDRPSFAAARSFADLTDPQLRLLAAQNGSTGLTKMAGTVAMWHHDMDFQPSDGTADQGRLERIAPDSMHEHGLDGSYTEAWRSPNDARGRFLVVRVEHSGRLVRSLIVVGNRFIYARNRTQDLPRARSFDALIASTNPTREQLVAYLDCEFSEGTVRGGAGPWAIEKSTLPWREGHRLAFAAATSIDVAQLSPVPRDVGDEQWTVPVNTLSPLEFKQLFSGESK